MICLRILLEPFWFYHRMITNINGLNKSMVMSNINIRFIIVLLSCQMYIILSHILRRGKKSQFARYIRITRYKSQYRTHPLKDGVKMHLLPACKFSKQCILHISRYFPCQFTFFIKLVILDDVKFGGSVQNMDRKIG